MVMSYPYALSSCFISSSTLVTERRPNFVQDGQQVRRQEARRSRPGDDVGHAEREQGQQNNDRFLLEPESTSDSGRSFTPQPSFSASVTARMMAEYASLH